MTLYLVDGNSYIHRAYHAIRNLTTSKGELVNAVYGFTRMLLKILKQYKPDYIAVCLDYPAPTFRHKEFSEYKMHRKKTTDELKNQFPYIKQIMSALNLTVYEKEGYEADDLIATISSKAKKQPLIETVIVTGDKDALQLVDEKVKVLNEPKDILYDRDEVIKKLGVAPERVVDFLALSGDTADNIPGVPGIGEKTAAKIIQQFGSIENILKNYMLINGKVKDLIARHFNSAILSKKLVTLVNDIPIEIDFEQLKPNAPDNKKFIDILRRLEFFSLIPEMGTEEKGGIETAGNYKIVSAENDLKKLVEYIKTKNEFAFLVSNAGWCLSCQKNTGFYIPLSHQTLSSTTQFHLLPVEMVVRYLTPLFENNNIVKITHSIKSQLSFLYKYGILFNSFGNVFDTEIASYLLNPSRKNHSLVEIGIEYLGTKLDDFNGNPENIEVQEAKDIFGKKTNLILQCSQMLTSELSDKKLLPLFQNIEMPLTEILYKMEKTGIKLDDKYLRSLAHEFSEQLQQLEKMIFSMAGEEFNINSPKQLAYILFDKLGLQPVKKTKTGFSTDEEVLSILAQTAELPKLLLNYREISKLKSTFIDALLEKINPQTKRLHTSFNQTITSTGRLSSSEPNLQNIPVKTELGKKIRRGFVAETGYILASLDYSQIDLRVLAHITKDKMLCEAFQKGGDIHISTASEVFGLKKEEITAEMRNRAKGINFGIVYGQQAWGLSQQLGITTEEAQKYIDQYFGKYSGVKNWITETIKNARETGFVTTLLGRIRYLPEINSQNQQMRAFAERTAINTPIQGTAADIIKVAMININKRCKMQDVRCRMLVQVHDELLFEIKDNEINTFIPMIKTEMEHSLKLDIPVVVDVKIGKNWADLEIIKNEK
ncbi:MAG: DNA polymerase I [Elusimicrobiota bacterium]